MSPDQLRSLLVDNLHAYRETLTEDRRLLLDQYRFVDGAIKVVGIGSVGTMCLVVLMMSALNKPLFLQYKEARESVLERYAGKSAYAHHGQRVVMGQRLMQPATDVFMGWLTGALGRQGYVRQLRDAKIKPLVETFDAETLSVYGTVCGWALARAHAKGGDETTISGYLGIEENFDVCHGQIRNCLCRPGRARPRGPEDGRPDGQDRRHTRVVNAGCRRIADRSDKRAAFIR